MTYTPTHGEVFHENDLIARVLGFTFKDYGEDVFVGRLGGDGVELAHSTRHRMYYFLLDVPIFPVQTLIKVVIPGVTVKGYVQRLEAKFTNRPEEVGYGVVSLLAVDITTSG